VLPTQSDTPNRINGGSCSTPCPLITFNENDYDNSDRLAKGLAVCSFIVTVFLLSTWLIFPEKRKQKYVLNFFITVFIISILCMVNAFGPYSPHVASVGCANNSREIEQADGGWCVFESVVINFATISGFYWWLINAIDVCLKVVFNFRPSTGSKQMKIKEGIYLSLGWGLGIISTIVTTKIHT
jgi:hypothetical protein